MIHIYINADDDSIRNFDFKAKHNIPDQVGNILIVDDESANLDLLNKILKQSNHKIHMALNGSDALKLLSKKSINIDLISDNFATFVSERIA